MTDLKTLVEAIERKDDKKISMSSRYAACARIADSFCCQDAISAQRLEALGFLLIDGTFLFGVMRAWERNHIGRANAGFYFSIVEGNKAVSMRPQPHTMGDVMRRLEELTRPETTK